MIQHQGLQKCLLALLLILCPSATMLPGTTVLALDPQKAITEYVHDVWTAENGLPQNTVATVTQTRDGYLWLGTYEGLVRFDGVKFTVFDMSNTPAMKSNQIRVLYEGHDGSLWIGTQGGG